MAEKKEEKKPAAPYAAMGKILKQGQAEKEKEKGEKKG